MMQRELTAGAGLAKTLPMQGNRKSGGFAGRRGKAAAVLVAATMALSGCVSVNAPDKPIVIELNINIKQEVVYRLAQDAEKTIDTHKDIF